jgi:hypothetical protein
MTKKPCGSQEYVAFEMAKYLVKKLPKPDSAEIRAGEIARFFKLFCDCYAVVSSKTPPKEP